ncbi:MAG TPA: hypothetical protein VK644_09845 [Chitinophagaceae bacterium]|nr:hypothetical protein [Chitinophagaceae bacterium]
MQRYNLFNQVHKELRVRLYETALEVEHTEFWNVDEAETTLRRIAEVVEFFEKHRNTEDNLVFTIIGNYEPSVKDAFGQEQLKGRLLGQMLSECIVMYRAAAIITEKAQVGRLLKSAYVKFMMFNVEHMAREEDVLNPIAWRYLTDEELKNVNRESSIGNNGSL